MNSIPIKLNSKNSSLCSVQLNLKMSLNISDSFTQVSMFELQSISIQPFSSDWEQPLLDSGVFDLPMRRYSCKSEHIFHMIEFSIWLSSS